MKCFRKKYVAKRCSTHAKAKQPTIHKNLSFLDPTFLQKPLQLKCRTAYFDFFPTIIQSTYFHFVPIYSRSPQSEHNTNNKNGELAGIKKKRLQRQLLRHLRLNQRRFNTHAKAHQERPIRRRQQESRWLQG